MAFFGKNCFLYLSLRFFREIKIMVKMRCKKHQHTFFSVKLKKFLTKSISQKNSQWNGVKVWFGVEKKDVEVFFSQFHKIQSISNWFLLDLLLSNFINYSNQHRQKYFINCWIFIIDFFFFCQTFFFPIIWHLFVKNVNLSLATLLQFFFLGFFFRSENARAQNLFHGFKDIAIRMHQK